MAKKHVIRNSRIDCHLDTTWIHLAYTLRQNQAKSGEVRQLPTLLNVGHEQIVAGYNSINQVRYDTLRARAREGENKILGILVAIIQCSILRYLGYCFYP